MGSRGGRDRFRGDYPPRSEDKGRSNPPSRHLWVGNISHSIDESILAHHFLQFGELESVACQPGRSYAFINYKNEEDAFAAIAELQGFVLGGNPLKIEFTKAEKSSLLPRGEEYVQRRDEQRSMARRSPYLQRDTKLQYSSPDPPYMDKPKTSDNSEPSEVLWIGFPAKLKVDEFILRKAFSPFGEIDKITAFPGRTYAFVRFRNVMAAGRAKDTLQGKLFGNPRVHICFARNESGTSSRERNATNTSPSPHFRSFGSVGSPNNSHQERHHASVAANPSMRLPYFVSDLESGNPDVMGYGRKGILWRGDGASEQLRIPEGELGPPGPMYDPRNSPLRGNDGHFRALSPRFPPEGLYYDDPRDLVEDVSLFRGAKKVKIGSFDPDNELPEYPLFASDKSKRIPEFPQTEPFDKNLEAGPLGYKPNAHYMVDPTHPYGESSEPLNVPPYDGFHASSVPLPSKPDWKRLISESKHSSSNKEWEWEGTIAKGGTPVCRARCFPVGKVMGLILPEFLDCTARTSLDMLVKNYYQAASAWVVFFVPANDLDISYYNDFMNYLGEKQRAAVAKLDDRTTLFLVPPSEFSEKVLKVPGRLSISGVVLRLDQPSFSNVPLHQRPELDSDLTYIHGNAMHPRPESPSGSYPKVSHIPYSEKPGFSENFSKGVSPASGSAQPISSISDSNHGNRHGYLHQQQNLSVAPNWHPHDVHGGSNKSSVSNRTADSIGQGYSMSRFGQDNFVNYKTEISPTRLNGNSNSSVQERPPVPSSRPAAALQTEQFAHLASSLFGQLRQSAGASAGEDFRQPGTIHQQPENSYRPAENYAPANRHVTSDLSSSQLSQVQQRQHDNVTGVIQRDPQPSCQVSQQQPNAGQDEDPQKRLQATLQLAAVLLQQIQQGKGT